MQHLNTKNIRREEVTEEKIWNYCGWEISKITDRHQLIHPRTSVKHETG